MPRNDVRTRFDSVSIQPGQIIKIKYGTKHSASQRAYELNCGLLDFGCSAMAKGVFVYVWREPAVYA